MIVHLIELTESKAAEARQKADKVALTAAARISDLDQEETPESIMLSSMTEEGAKDRTDREVVVPWLKFLWETYRAILELLHRNAKLDKIYHKTCEKAFKFCQDYNRTLEFRRLCDMLRLQLANLQKLASAPYRAARGIVWEWTPEAVELHMQTRFNQLEVATTLELWNEGFRTVEDIFNIMQLGKKTPKPKLMSIYYEKLTRIFWVSENYLFHAYAWFRYYTLTCEYRKDMKMEERNILASCVLLAALSVPSLKEFSLDAFSTNSMVSDDDEVATEKNQQLATLLDFQANPTRKALLGDIVSRGILNDVIPELANIFDHMEVKFHPLKLAAGLVPMIAAIKSHPQLSVYAIPLERIAVLRVVQQLSRVYSAVRIDFLRNLVAPLSDISYNTVEKIMIDGVSRKQLQLRIDHGAKCIKFGTAVVTANTIENQVSQLGVALSKVASTLTRALGGSAIGEKEAASRKEFLNKVAAAEARDHASTVNHQRLIEQRKEKLEEKQREKAEEEEKQRELQRQQRAEEERQRLEQEAKNREAEQRKKLREKQDLINLKQALESYSVIKDEAELTALDVASRNAMLNEAKLEAQRAKDAETRRVSEQAKRLDHITRALRIEGANVIKTKYAKQVEDDRAAYEVHIAKLQVTLREEHAHHLVEKARLSKMQSLRKKFEDSLLAKQMSSYEKKVAKAKQDALQERRERKVATARQKYAEEQQRYREEEEEELERQANLERDRLEIERAEELRRKRMAEEEAEKLREAREEKERKERQAQIDVARAAAAQLEAERAAARAATMGGGGQQQDRGGEDSWTRQGPRGSSGAFPSQSSQSRPIPSSGADEWRRERPEPSPSTASSAPLRSNLADETSKWRGSARLDTSSAPPVSPASKPAEEASDWRSARGGARGDGSLPPKNNAPTRNLDDWGRSGPSKPSGDRDFGRRNDDKKDEGNSRWRK